MFFISKIQKKKIVFSFYSQKQVFENRKQKLLPNITLYFLMQGAPNSFKILFLNLKLFLNLVFNVEGFKGFD